MLKGQKYHYLYKIICKITNKYYFGVHSTSNLSDGYLGSGAIIKNSIKKYGSENHEKIIIVFFNDRESLFKAEKELITEDVIKDPLCMNISRGGLGGIQNKNHGKKLNSAGNKAFKEKLKEEKFREDFFKKCTNKLIESNKIRHKLGLVKYDTFKGKKHSEASIEKIRNSKKGHGLGNENSQYNKMWITDGFTNKKISKDAEIPNGWNKGRVFGKEFSEKVKKAVLGKSKGRASTLEKELERRKKISETKKRIRI